MAENTWHAARLIPTSGISGAEEQERRATSALLAVMSAVKEFGRAITAPLGAPAGTIETFIEVPFTWEDKRLYPDGLVRISRSSRSWVCLVEVKTGSNQLESTQLESYLEVARVEGFDALLTISNEIPAIAGTHPTTVDKRKLRKVPIYHLSWTHVLTQAVMQKVHRGVADPDQAWILGELIRYLEHPRSGALEFEDMGPSWVPLREAVAAGTLRASDKAAAEVASRWDQLIRYACLRLGRQLGIEVQPVLSRRELADPSLRAHALVEGLVNLGVLDGALRIPNAVGPVTLTADLRARRVSASVDIDAPREGRPQTRVNWLVRQLKGAPETLRVDCFALHGRGASTSELLRDVRANPATLIDDPKRELRGFRLTASGPMGVKRGQGKGSFVGAVLDLLDGFYASTVQTIKPWAAAPPKLRPQPPPGMEEDVPPQIVSTSLSSQDGAAVGEAVGQASLGTPPALDEQSNLSADDGDADEEDGGGADGTWADTRAESDDESDDETQEVGGDHS